MATNFGRLGEATVEVRAPLDKLDKDFRDGRRKTERAAGAMDKAMGKFRRGVERASRAVFNWRSAMAAAAGVTGLVLFTRNAIRFADSIAKTADRIGIGVEALQEFRFAADRAGVQTRLLDDSLTRLNRRVGLFISEGGGPAAKAFETLGLAGDIASGKLRGTENVFNAVIAALQGVSDESERTALLSQVVGEDAGPRLANLVNQGVDAIDDLRQSARDLNLVLGEETVRKAEIANDRLDEMAEIFKINATALSLEFMPVMRELAEVIADPDFVKGTREFAQNMTAAISFIANNADTVQRIIGSLVGLLLLSRLGPRAGLAGAIAGAFSPEIIGVFSSEVAKASERVDALTAAVERQKAAIQEAREFGGEVGRVAAEAGESRLAKLEEELASSREILQSAEEAREAYEKLGESISDTGVVIGKGAGENLTEEIKKIKDATRDLRFEADLLSGDYSEAVEAAGRAVKAAGLVDELSDLESASDEVKQAVRDFLEEFNRLSKLREALQVIQDTKSASDEYAETLRRLKELYDEGLISLRQYSEAIRQAGENMRSTREETEEVTDAQRDVEDTARDLGLTFTSAFEDAIVEGKEFREVLEGIRKDLLRLAVRKTITEPVLNAFTDIGTSIGASLGLGPATPTTPTQTFGVGNIGASTGEFFRGQQGAIFTRPTTFPTFGGMVQAGEAGRKEAALPLTNVGGDLGVSASGLPTPEVEVNVYAPPGSSVREERDERSGRLDIFIDEAMANNVRPGTRFSRALQNRFSVRQQTTSR